MSADAAARFAQHRWAGDAVALRRWDDSAKVPGLAVPGLEAYRRCLGTVLLPEGADERGV